MKEKSPIEKNAAQKQAGLLIQALAGTGEAGRYWLNPSGKTQPRFYPKGVSVSPFNALIMALDSDAKGCKTNLYTLFSEAKQRGEPVREHEKGAPFLFYNWNRYVNRNNPEDAIDRKAYLQLPEECKLRYKGLHDREVRTVFNVDQTLLPLADAGTYAELLEKDGGAEERGHVDSDDRKLHVRVNDFLLKMRDNLVPVRMDGSGIAHYDSTKDAVYVPRQKDFEHYHDYVQEVFRQVVSATGHQQRLAREGMVMKDGKTPSEDAVRQERLVVELASGLKMLEMGLPARLAPESMALTDYWARELKENPRLIDIIESDVNNALDVVHKAERGEKIEYATRRNRRETDKLEKEQPPRHFIADEIARHPDREKKTFVVVKGGDGKSADVILPAGASPEADNEVPGMSKQRIRSILGREGIESVAFHNPDGELGYRPDDATFEGRQVTVARLRNWSMETLSTLDVSEAARQARTVRFEQVQMIQDDERRWALYIKPEGKAGYSVYPDKDDLNRFFTTLKQAMQNISAVRGELANKYYLLAESRPELKADLFSCPVQDIDLNRIERVSVYKTRQDGIRCAAIVDGKQLQPRSVTPQQWQRMWVADDPVRYKKHLAATLYADVLRKGQTQEKTTGEKESADTEQTQREKVAIDKPAENMQPGKDSADILQANLFPSEQWKQLKEKHPDTVLLFRNDNSYEAYKEDAGKAGKVLGLEVRKAETSDGQDMETLAFPSKDLDMFLPKLVRTGCRVAVCDRLEPKQERLEEQAKGMKR